jgi:hypothetical protein
MTVELLHETGRALYGDYWMAALARDLEVADRTMQRWANGVYRIPDGIAGDLERLCAERVLELTRIRAKLRGLP